jgi:hypothetical protein
MATSCAIYRSFKRDNKQEINDQFFLPSNAALSAEDEPAVVTIVGKVGLSTLQVDPHMPPSPGRRPSTYNK